MTPAPTALGIVCTDLARSLAFYRALGLDIPADADAAPHVAVTLDSGFTLMWDPVDTITSFDPSWSPAARDGARVRLRLAGGRGRHHAAVVGAGYDGHLEPFDAFWGQRYASLRDPDGNGVDLFAALPT